DSRVTTHPIEMPIASTADFFTVFDAITYDKGSSVLKQLAHLVGEERYRKGVAAYLKMHAYDTTELLDFIEAQARSAERPLAGWSDQWLHTRGFNTLEPSFVCSDDRLTELSIMQTAPKASSTTPSEKPLHEPTLRTHQLDVALFFNGADGALQVGVVLAVEVAGEITEVAIPQGTLCPVLVFPNHHDWAYAKPRLPEAVIRAFVDRIAQVDDPLARSALLDVLFDRARDGDLSLQALLRSVIDNARTELNFRVLSQLVRELTELVALLERLSPEADELLAGLEGELESLAWEKLQTETSDEKLLWTDLYINIARSTEGLDRLRSLLDGGASIDGLPLSQDKRWQILVRLAAYGIVEEQIVTELKTDPSDRGEKMAIAARATQPDLGVKRNWLAEIQNPDSTMGLAEKRFAIYNLVPPNQTSLGLTLIEDILNPLNELSQHSDHYFISHYVRGLLGNTCHSEGVNKMAVHLETPERLSSTALRFLREAHQADSECAALRAQF
ncbi:MAG: ERAP1-like C-terminal domain-containing protein, partial [Gammaproteobacteria bacterium]|nr:ERAP1-like C-terminal domain-containing protein [Gammaproteobacteria bacterium]